MNDADIIAAILGVEKGLVDNPSDHGGITNCGITISTLSMYLGRDATAEDIRAITPATAAPVYQSLFIDRPGFHLILDGKLRYAVVDAAVQHWTSLPAQWIQQVARVNVDGKFGPNTAAAVNSLNPASVAIKFNGIRLRFYGRIMARDHTQATFAAGWMDRVANMYDILA